MSSSSRATDGTPLRFASPTPPVQPLVHTAIGLSRSPSTTSASDVDIDDGEGESAEESDLDLLDETTARPPSLNPALATASSAGGWPYTSSFQSSPAFIPTTAYPPIQIPASSLPHEILLQILRLLSPVNLSPALLVCKAWCQCGVELLWHKPSFNNLGALLRMLMIIGSSKPETLTDSRHEVDDMMMMSAPTSPTFTVRTPTSTALIPTTPTLGGQATPSIGTTLLDRGTTFPYPAFIRRLNFSSIAPQITDGILARLRPCLSIERLTLTSCTSVTPSALCDLLKHCKRLIALDLSEVTVVEDLVLEEVARSCKKLQGLNLSGCARVTDLGVEAIARGCPGLRRIKLRSLNLLTDTPIIVLSLCCPLLLEVDLVSCQLITSSSLRQLFRTSGHLRELSLAGCSEIDDTGFPPGDENGSAEDHLNINGHGNEDGSLTIVAPTMIATLLGSSIMLPPPLSNSPTIVLFDHLRYLDLTSLSLLTDTALEGIVKYMPRIRNLILAKCVGITDLGVESICKLGKALHYLHLGHVSSITDRAVTKLARSCTRLRYIDLACCNLLTDLSVFELATNLPRLKRIGLVRVASLTDQAIYALFARPSLERIHLSYCENITLQAIHDLLQHLPRLTHLSLTGVPAFRREDLQKWCRTPPRDFNSHQRSSFCVYSGPGVRDLRRHLRAMSTPASAPSVSSPASNTLPLAAVEEDHEPSVEVERRGGTGYGIGGGRASRPRAVRNNSSTTAVNGDLGVADGGGGSNHRHHHHVRQPTAPSIFTRNLATGHEIAAFASSQRFWPIGTSAETHASNGLGTAASTSLNSPFQTTTGAIGEVRRTAVTTAAVRESTRPHDHGTVGHGSSIPDGSVHHHHHHHHPHPDQNHPSNMSISRTSSTLAIVTTTAAGGNRSRRSTVTRANYLRARNGVAGASTTTTDMRMEIDDEAEMSSEEVDEGDEDVEMN